MEFCVSFMDGDVVIGDQQCRHWYVLFFAVRNLSLAVTATVQRMALADEGRALGSYGDLALSNGTKAW
jgi:hypothetical protein